MAKRILVPTDFSEVALDAFNYACQLAAKTDIERIDLVHWYTPQTASDALMIPPINEIMEVRRESLQKFQERATIPKSLEIRAEVAIGFAADEAIEQSSNYEWIIMGATGINGLLEQVFGSVSSAVAQRAHCPVLLVPGGVTFKEPRQIMYASHDIAISKEVIHKLINFNHLFHARVHFIEVIETDEPAPTSQDRQKLFAALFEGPDPDFAFEIGEVEAETVEEGLRSYLSEHAIDLVVMATQIRGFWEGFFHRSQVKKMALHPDVPLLVFHVEGE